jgi:hypothetical protein
VSETPVHQRASRLIVFELRDTKRLPSLQQHGDLVGGVPSSSDGTVDVRACDRTVEARKWYSYLNPSQAVKHTEVVRVTGFLDSNSD